MEDKIGTETYGGLPLAAKLVLTFFAVVIIAACAVVIFLPQSAQSSDNTNPVEHGSWQGIGNSAAVAAIIVPLKNGGKVDCIVYDGYRSGGLSCDWGSRR